MMKKHRSCNELGVCQGLGADQCPDCDSFECEVPCADAPAPTRPLASVVYPFAPGVIERTTNSTSWYDEEDCGLPLSLGELAFVAALVSGCGALGGLLATWAMRWSA
jgi:hypothetical protein